MDELAKDLIETWLVGKLSVPQSRQEAVTALDLVNPPVDEVWLDKTLASLEPGQFVLRSCRLDELQVFEAR